MEYVTLGNYCSITSSKRIFAEQYVEKGVPFYRSKEIIEKNNGQDISEPLYIEPEVYETIKKKFGVPQQGDLLLTSVGTIGIPYIVKDEQFYFKDGNLTWMRDFSKELSSKYLYYWISSKFGKDSLVNRCIGSSQAALTIDILKNYKLLIPKREIQDKIVSILSAYDSLIENNNKRIKILEQMAENLYKEWFVRFRFPGHETIPLENGIPKGWSEEKLSAVFEVKYGKDHKNIEDGLIPIFGSGGIMRYGNKALCSEESVLIPRKGSLNNVMYYKGDFWTVDTMFYTKMKIKHCAKYTYFTLSKVDLEGLNSGASIPSMTMDILYHLKMIVPDESTLIAFDKQIDLLFAEKDSLELQNQNLIKQRDLLLPRLMSGKLAV